MLVLGNKNDLPGALSVEQLIDYPYSCTEQLTSRLVPLLPLRELGTEFKLNVLFFYKRTIALSLDSSDFRRASSSSTIDFVQ